MANLVNLTNDERRNLIAEILEKYVQIYPFEDVDNFNVFLNCKELVRLNKFDENSFEKLLRLPNGKLYYNVIKSVALVGYVKEEILKAFEKKYLYI